MVNLGTVGVELKLRPGAKAPTQAHPGDAGLDLYAHIPNEGEITIYPKMNKLISVGFQMAIPNGYFGGIYARSGMATKLGLRLSNSVGVVDAGYRGEVLVPLYNDSPIERVIKNGDKIAQMIIQPIPQVSLSIVDELSETERGDGGFGSTDKAVTA